MGLNVPGPVKAIIQDHWAVVGFIVIVTIGIGGKMAGGKIYSSLKARDLIESLSDSALYLGSAIAGSSGTILALMLTLVGLIRRMDTDFDHKVYRRISAIATVSAINLIGAVILLLMLTMPVGDFEDIPEHWYPTFFNILYGLTVFISALSVAIIIMLLQTVNGLIAKITPSDDV